jgi:hypothetical protein
VVLPLGHDQMGLGQGLGRDPASAKQLGHLMGVQASQVGHG